MGKKIALTLITALALCVSQFAQAQGNKAVAKYSREGFEATKSQDWNKAVEAFRKATELDKKQTLNLVSALQHRGMENTTQQKYQEAIADFSEALKLKSNDADIYERRAYVEMKTNDLDKALADYSEAIKFDPKEIRYYLLRGYIYEIKEDVKNSMADTEKALKLDPKNAEAKSRKERLEAKEPLTPPLTPIPSSPRPSPAAKKSP